MVTNRNEQLMHFTGGKKGVKQIEMTFCIGNFLLWIMVRRHLDNFNRSFKSYENIYTINGDVCRESREKFKEEQEEKTRMKWRRNCNEMQMKKINCSSNSVHTVKKPET